MDDFHNALSPPPSEPPDANAALLKTFALVQTRATGGKLFATFFIANLLVVFMRPQAIFSPFEAIKLPLLVSLFPIGAWLTTCQRPWTLAMKLMAAFLALGMVTGIFAVNTFWSFETFRSMVQLALGVIFPLIMFMSCGSQLHRLSKVFLFISLYLAVYGLTHAGTGPGDYLGDENDYSFALNMLIGPALSTLPLLRSFFARLVVLGTALLMMAAVVVSWSRGGFVGLFCVLLYFIFRSQRKVLALSMIGLIAVGGYFVLPSSYKARISTIKQTDEGTAKQRRVYWAVAFRVFLDPRNIVQGVGFGNIPFRVGDYEPAENRGPTGKSIAGREVHSLYFELLSETGLIGTTIMAWLVFSCFRGNTRAARETLRRLRSLRASSPPVAQVGGETNDVDLRLGKEWLDARRRLSRELRYLSFLFTALNASWIGVLVSGAFVSVLYYPPLWVLAAFSSAAQRYWRNLSPVAKNLAGSTRHDVVASPAIGLIEE